MAEMSLPDESALDAIKWAHACMEMKDDLMDVREDEIKGCWNVVLLLARVHGREGAHAALLDVVAEVQRNYQAGRGLLIVATHHLNSSEVALAKCSPQWRSRLEEFLWKAPEPCNWELTFPEWSCVPATGSFSRVPLSLESLTCAQLSLQDAYSQVSLLRGAWSTCEPLWGLPQCEALSSC